MIEAVSILSFGFVLGLRHALDADHLIAVSTIVSRRKGFWGASLVGAVWGLGHTASLLIVGLLVIVFHFQIPEKIASLMEFSVGLMLILLGLNVLWKIRKGATLHVHTHEHHQHLHIHPHIHKHANEKNHEHAVGKKPFVVGMVHGLAGSAGLMLVVLATISSRSLALIYISVFGVGSVGGMFLMSAAIGMPFSLTSQHERLHHIVQFASGIISVCFGLLYSWQTAVAGGMF